MARIRFDGTFIRNTAGDWIAVEQDGHIWDLRGEWIGWIEGDQDVYKVDGEWVGQLHKDGRIIRKRTDRRRDLNVAPARPEPPEIPVRAPLPPAFTELTFSQIDVLEEDPDAFKKLSDLRPDME